MDNSDGILVENLARIPYARAREENELFEPYPSTSTANFKEDNAANMPVQNLNKKFRQNRRRMRVKHFAQPLDETPKQQTRIEDEYSNVDDINKKLSKLLIEPTPTQDEKILNDAKLFKKKQTKKLRSHSTTDFVDFVHGNERYLSNSCDRNRVFENSIFKSRKDKRQSRNQSQVLVEKQRTKNRKMSNKSNDQVFANYSEVNQGLKIKEKAKKKKKTSAKSMYYDDYLTREEVEVGLQNESLFYGSLRINPRDYKTAYISSPNKNEQDVMIMTIRDRNRALDGDIVVVKRKDREENQSFTLDVGSVVFIKEVVHPRVAVGTLKNEADKKEGYRLFRPRDSRLPRLRIPYRDKIVSKTRNDEEMLYLARICEWTDIQFARGELLECIGSLGELLTESRALLLENGLDADEPSLEEMKEVAEICSKPLTEIEIASRLDLREKCVFTIDPLTARDLDDAVSCVEMPDGSLEIGVHIADVTHYVADGSPLDKVVQNRATSIYMVDAVRHMLPVDLCAQCSLLPNKDRLAFSVIWLIEPTGKILEHKFARTVIRTCVQLAYEHAQLIIDQPNCDPKSLDLPTVHGGHSVADVTKAIQLMHALSMRLRTARYASGALQIDQPKVSFQLDKATREPISFELQINKESNQMIEEFMLLANMTVAERLQLDFPSLAFLRSHPPPVERMLKVMSRTLEKVGIHLDVTSAGGLQRSLARYTSAEDDAGLARGLVLNALCARPMSRAIYFCLASAKTVEDCEHYALNIPLYTHFTSPIRRYADVMVHRLLAASINNTSAPNWSSERVASIATHCNKRKYSAKRAGEQSIELFLVHYIGKREPLRERAVVVDVKDNSFDAIVMSNGMTIRVYFNNLAPDVTYEMQCDENNSDNSEEQEYESDDSKRLISTTLFWPGEPPVIQTIALFSVVEVILTRRGKTVKLDAYLARPSGNSVQ